MTDEITQEPVSEANVDTGIEQASEVVQTRQVPLEALEAERHKRQEAEQRARIMEEYVQRAQAQADASKTTVDDESDLVNKRDLRDFSATERRNIVEEIYQQVNPEAIKQINTHLKEILETKPWLAESIQNAPNRYARAFEVVQAFSPVPNTRSSGASDAQRIIENSKKPGSPVTVAKTAQLSGADYMKSIAGTKEFRDYRRSVVGK